MKATRSKNIWSVVLVAWASLAWGGGEARAAPKAEGAKLEISGVGWWGDRDLRHTLELLLGRSAVRY
jgi:hypothetical protein